MDNKSPNPAPDEIFTGINLPAIKSYLFDLPAGATVGMRSAREGYIHVVFEITSNQPKLGDQAGITATQFSRFLELNDQYEGVKKQLPVVQKAVEVLRESRAYVDNLRHRLITMFANSVEECARMEGDAPALLIAYEKTVSYRSVIADKAVKTRRKNEEAKNQPSVPQSAEEPAPAAPAAPATPAAPAAPEATDDEVQHVVRTPNPPPDMIFGMDLKPLQPFLIDLLPGATRGMRKEQPGYEAVRQEILDRQATFGDRGGITATDFQRFQQLEEEYAMIMEQLPKAEKAEEVLTESLAYLDNLRHQLVTRFANSAEEHAHAAGGDPTLLTAYEKTISYRSIIASKGVRNRK